MSFQGHFLLWKWLVYAMLTLYQPKLEHLYSYSCILICAPKVNDAIKDKALKLCV